MLRKILCAILVLVLLFALSGCEWLMLPYMILITRSNDDIKSKEDVSAFVEENQDKLLSCIKQREASALEGYGIIKSIDESGNYIEFYCGGSGFGSQTNYSGFFYSKNGNFNAARSYIAPEEFVLKDEGYYWQEEIGDNSYYVEHICGDFYYYIEHY